MLERYRTQAQGPLARLARPFGTTAPDVLSWTAFLLAALAALLYIALRPASDLSPWLLPLTFFGVAVAIFLSGLFDALDGYVARMQSRTSRRGDVLDHVLDRYADMVIFLGIALSGWAIDWLALLALVSLLLVSYMGTQAQAATGQRQYGGWLGRADRLVLLSGSALILAFASFWDLVTPTAWELRLRFVLGGTSVTLLDAVLLYTIVASQLTAAWRAWTTWTAARGVGPAPPGTSAGSSSMGASGSPGPHRAEDAQRPSP